MSRADVQHGPRAIRWLTERGWWFVPLLLSVALSLPWIFGDRWYSDTSYYQAIATQMVRRGDWWSLMQGDLHYFNKPPLAFWMHAVLVGAFGNTDWATHAPEAVCYVLTCLLTGWLGVRLHGRRTGLLAGCAMALTNEWVWRVANFKLDMPHTLLLLAACACWVRAFVALPAGAPGRATRAQSPVKWSLLAGVCIGAALMTKPLIGLGLPILGIAWLSCAGLLDRRRAGLVAMGGLVGALVALPWHASMAWQYGDTFVRTYLVEQSVKRATGEMFAENKPWWWYFRHMAGNDEESVAPWTMWPIYGLALAGLAVVAARWRSGSSRAGDALAALWVIVWMAAISAFSGKRNYYVMVIHPGTAWLAGIALTAGVDRLGRIIEGPARKRVAERLCYSCGYDLSKSPGAPCPECGREQNEAGIRRASYAVIDRAIQFAALLGLLACVVLLWRVPHAVHKARRELPVPERDQFMAFLREHNGEVGGVYNCGLPYRMAALAYIEADVWPKSLRERTPMDPAGVPPGGLMVYRDDMLSRKEFGANMDPADQVVFRSAPEGHYIVARRR